MAASGVPAEHDDYCLKEYKYLYSPDILSRKVAFISGGGSGIGFRIAELFMRHGCDTVIASRKMSKLEEVRGREFVFDSSSEETTQILFWGGGGACWFGSGRPKVQHQKS